MYSVKLGNHGETIRQCYYKPHHSCYGRLKSGHQFETFEAAAVLFECYSMDDMDVDRFSFFFFYLSG